MAFNLSGIDEEFYISINTAAHVSLFFFVALPTLILSTLCVVAMLFAEDINQNTKFLLINIFITDIVQWVALSILFLGFPMRARMQSDEYYSCSIAIGLLMACVLQKFSVLALSAITLYFFTRYGTSFKWIGGYTVLSTMVSIAVGLAPHFEDFGLYNNHGFCEGNTGAPLMRAVLYLMVLVVTGLFSIVITFNMLTYRYVEKSTLLQVPPGIKKEIVQNLRYLNVAVVLSLIFELLPASSPFIRAVFEKESLATTITINYILCLALHMPSALAPIAAVIILDPLRLALKEGYKKYLHRIHRKGD